LKATWAEIRAAPERSESKQLISTASSAFIFGK